MWADVAKAIKRALGIVYGCLFIIGDDMGCSDMRNQFLHDVEILKHWSQHDTDDSRVVLHQMACKVREYENALLYHKCAIDLAAFSAQQQRNGVENYAFKSVSGNIVEWVVVDNQPKDVVLEVIEEFFSAGYLYSYFVYGGHGHPDGGHLLLQIPECEDERLPLAQRSISREEFYAAASKSKGILPGTPGIGIINACFSHKFVGGQAAQSHQGFRLHAITDDSEPLAPAGGVLQLLLEKKSFETQHVLGLYQISGTVTMHLVRNSPSFSLPHCLTRRFHSLAARAAAGLIIRTSWCKAGRPSSSTAACARRRLPTSAGTGSCCGISTPSLPQFRTSTRTTSLVSWA